MSSIDETAGISSSEETPEGPERQREWVDFTPTDYPVMMSASSASIAPGLVDTVAMNVKIVLNSLGVPAVAVLYYRMKCSGTGAEASHMFLAIDEKQRVIRIPPSRLAMITSTIDPRALKEYTGSMSSDPLGALLLKSQHGGLGERVSRFPPLFGFRAPPGGKPISYDRRPEIEALRRDGYFALTLLPVPGVDHRIQLATEIASLWGYSLAAYDKQWPDLLILRNDNSDRDDLGGVPDETWMQHALSRVLEDHLPIVEIDGLWMGSLLRDSPNSLIESRSRVFYAVLDWVRMKKLPYITARTFHCYVRRDLSAIVTLGSLRDRMELTEWLEVYPYDKLRVTHTQSELAAANIVFKSSRNIALRNSANRTGWIVVHNPESSSESDSLDISTKTLEQELRQYYSNPETCNAPGSPLKSSDVANLKLDDLLKIIRISECESATSGVCILSSNESSATTMGENKLPESWTTSHRAYRAAVRSHVLRSHESLGVYRLGPYRSQFFAAEVHKYVQMLASTSRYQPIVSQVTLAPDIGETEDELLKVLVGTVWLLSVKEPATPSTPENEIDIMQVSSDRDGELVRKVLFNAWRSGHLIGTWCRVMLTHRDSLSISVAGGTVDPLVAHAGDSIVDGNRWIDITTRALSECSSRL